MKGRAQKTVKRLKKKGMTRAFIQVDGREYIYPEINGKSSRHKIIIPAAAVTAVLVFLLLLQPWRPAPTAPAHTATAPIRTAPMTPLHLAAGRGNPREVKELLQGGAHTGAQDPYGWAPLHWAVFCKNEETCRLLLNRGASPSIPSTRPWFKFKAGLTPQHMANMLEQPHITALFSLPGGNRTKEK